jgi:hypothetical protein
MDFARLLHALRPACALLALAVVSSAARVETAQTAGPEANAQAVEAQPTEASGAADRQLLWGDTHVHTINSTDGFFSGSANADIETAYRYARGLPVLHPRTGPRIRIDRPLDFIVIADHAEMLSVSRRLRDRDEQIMATPAGRRLHRIWSEEGGRALLSALISVNNPGALEDVIRDLNVPVIREPGWAVQVEAAERNNRPGTFTAMIGWEWTSTPGGLNLHRVVFTDADGDVARQFLPFNFYDSNRPEDLWNFFEETRERTGADFIAMPHNSNLSNGLMFDLTDSDGNPFTAAYAARRARWEPVVEITQYKGTSETHPSLSPRDEFASYEIRERLLGPGPAMPEPGSFVRSALGRGLAEQARIGVNPFRFGLIGSTDSHTGFSSVREDDFLGKMGEDLFPAERANVNPDIVFPAWDMSASGLAGVWADSNTRRGIFDAFRRREVFATTGPRISLRLFAGYGFEPGDDRARDFAEIGYRRGVPMGGVLTGDSAGRAPQFVIRAVRDPRGANLDRVQVVKGWLGADGEMHERVYDVVWSGDRRIGADGHLPAVGNTVDLSTGRYRNTIGAAELAVLWRDPDFDPAQSAFYYVRVLEIPTPRHHVFDMLALGMDPASSNRPATIQERAFSSPVWYRP